MLCNSLVESFSEQVFGDSDTDPDDMVEDRLVTSEVESRVADTGLEAIPSPFISIALLAIVGMVVVSRVLLSGTLMGMG